jgi:anti-anti-sigma factor
MKIERQRIGTVEVCAPVGPLTEEDATQFTRVLLERIRASSARLVVSMREVPYFDSTALEGLVTASDELGEQAARLKLVQVNQTCREVLELTGLAPRFQFFEEVQDAVKSFL